MKSVSSIFSTAILISSMLIAAPVIAQNKVIRDMATFEKVSVSDNVNVTFKKGSDEKVEIISQGIDYDKIVTQTNGGELRIKLKTGFYKEADVNIEVTYKHLRVIEASNKATVKFAETVEGNELNLKANSNAVIIINVDVNTLKASVSNGGRIEVSGKAKVQYVDANIGGKYNGYELESNVGWIKSNTNAEAVVWVKETLDASAGSKGKIKYRGKVDNLKTNTSLGGKIEGNL